jgi:hypothetical protein
MPPGFHTWETFQWGAPRGIPPWCNLGIQIPQVAGVSAPQLRGAKGWNPLETNESCERVYFVTLTRISARVILEATKSE